jgi:hypothetical protein
MADFANDYLVSASTNLENAKRAVPVPGRDDSMTRAQVEALLAIAQRLDAVPTKLDNLENAVRTKR